MDLAKLSVEELEAELLRRISKPNELLLGPLDLLPWRVVGRSVCLSVSPSTPLTRQPMFEFFSKLVGIFLG